MLDVNVVLRGASGAFPEIVHVGVLRNSLRHGTDATNVCIYSDTDVQVLRLP